MSPSKSYSRIYAVVARVPRGSVATYGQIAGLAALDGHARQVGYALNALAEGSNLPWQRVINSRGEISRRAEPGSEEIQRCLLESEGVRFDGNGRVSLAEFLWKPGRRKPATTMPEKGKRERGPGKASSMAGYSATPLGKKLGIKPGFRVVLQSPPRGFSKLLGNLPPDTKILKSSRGKVDLVLLFCKNQKAIGREFSRWAGRLEPEGMLWLAWPKKASGVETDLNFGVVQKIGLRAGLVDNKICAIDETWSGLRFVRRLEDR